MPGAIQPHGALLVVRRSDGVVTQASVNAHDVLAVDEVLGRSIADVHRGLAELSSDEAVGSTNHRQITVDGASMDVFVRSTDDANSILLEVELGPGPDQVALADHQSDIVRSMQLMGEARATGDLLRAACDEVRRHTRFDRVMAYRFETDGHGVVAAEVATDGLEPFLGLHYPASDIPRQARELYLEQWLRLIPDARYTPVPLARIWPELDAQVAPLDLSECVLRAVSPIHLQYLANMGVRASMSVSLVVNGRLWGLIACHHYTGPHHVGHRARLACEFVGIAASSQLTTLEALEHSTRRAEIEEMKSQLLKSMAGEDSIADGLADQSAILLELVGATGAAIVLGDRTITIGDAPPPHVLQRVAAEIAAGDGVTMLVSDHFGMEHPGDDASSCAGLLAMPISRSRRNFIAWFRPPITRTITWAGRPTKDDSPAAQLTPRTSFAAWTESVEGRSVPWSPVEIEAVADLRASIGTFLLSQAERLAQLNDELSRSNEELDAFAYAAAHDLKEPLRGIHNFAGFLAEDYEDLLDDAGREKLATLMRLARRMATLLDSLLDYSSVGRTTLVIESIELAEVVTEVNEMLGVAVSTSGATVSCQPGARLRGDRAAIRQVLLNLISNAIKYCDRRPAIDVVVGVHEDAPSGGSPAVASSHNDEHVVISVIDNGIGIEPALIPEVFRVFRRLHDRDAYGGGSGAGLTIARRIVEHHGGRLWARSRPGEGSTFSFSVGTPQ